MGSCHSSLQSKEAVSRCKARRRYMRELSEGRQAFAAAHSLYLHFLRSTGAALLQFANAEAHLHVLSPLPQPPPLPPPRHASPPPPLPPPPPLSPISDNWTSTVTSSPILPPPPPPPPSSSAWDFWDPFAPPSSHSVTEEEWEEAGATISEVNAAPATTPPPCVISGFSKDAAVELAVVTVPRGKKNFSEIVEELDEYFVKASETGRKVSVVLEASSCGSASSNHGISGKMSSYCKSFNPLIRSWSSSPRAAALTSFRDSREEMSRVSHSCTIEKLYAWEKKLYLEVKIPFPILGNCSLMCMWRGMYECHQVQTHIVQQFQYLNNPSSTIPTSELHRQATLQLEAEIGNWYSAFCNLIKSQRDYIHAITGWLRLSLFQCQHDPLDRNHQNSEIYGFCEEWQLALDRVPDKVASEGIKSFLTVIHAIVIQQAAEHKLKKRSDSAFKELEKRSKELRSLERKYGPYSSEGYGDNASRSPVMEKKAKVDALKTKAEEEKTKYEKSSGITRAMTLNNLQTGFPNVFQAMTGFSSVCAQAFSAVYNHQRTSNISLNFTKMLT
ncbi:hypothetical protein KFK09_024120 [Dendrobium nobile]|uniref:Nitrate regulatory gene2 protein n=1 Tax=Dendrobium nobile TaxID=94219 RepID=A0A8T3ACZ4_DENNO|nr:hypothetical protein KFK09_024120 [Dendrobium nobile]